MNIIDLLDKKAISTELKSEKKNDVLGELVDLLIGADIVKKSEKNEILKRLKERENLGSTGIGKGVAIPHAKASKLKDMAAAFGISKQGLDFKSLDGEPTHLFFLLVASGENPGPHLKALAMISRLLDDKFVRERLSTSKTAQEVLNIIKEEENKKFPA